MMKAIVRKDYGDTDQLSIEEVPQPQPATDEVLIRVKAFGINRAEIYMRRGLWGDVARISGIECVGEVTSDPSGQLQQGQTVAAMMGGMGRSRNGSYAEFTCIPASNVIPLNTNMDWADLAAIPESYATAWSCLHDNMHLQPGATVVIRGGTSALGQAAINIAANTDDVSVIATSRNPQHFDLLKDLGCTAVYRESKDLSHTIRQNYPEGVDSVMDIIGNTTLLDSLQMVKKDGYVCNAGFLGGGDAIPFNPLTDMPPGVHLNFFASFMFGTEAFPLSNVPLQTIVNRSVEGVYNNQPVKVFNFEEIAQAHELMEQNNAGGKIVVRL